MSRETVKTHLSHIYGKLGVTNRTELAATARQRAATQQTGPHLTTDDSRPVALH